MINYVFEKLTADVLNVESGYFSPKTRGKTGHVLSHSHSRWCWRLQSRQSGKKHTHYSLLEDRDQLGARGCLQGCVCCHLGTVLYACGSVVCGARMCGLSVCCSASGLSVFGTQRLCDLFRQSSAQACRHRRGLDSSQAPAVRDLSQEVEILHDPPHSHQAFPVTVSEAPSQS